MKIDIYTHVLPPKYKETILQIGPPDTFWKRSFVSFAPMLSDMEVRFQLMDKHDGLMQVLTLGSPAVEDIADPVKAVDLAKLANDGMAELVAKYPDRFAAAVACLPMNNVEAALAEADRAITELGFKGVQITSPIMDKPLDSPEFMPLYEKMSQHDLPIWIHPRRGADFADCRGLDVSMYQIHGIFGWPYDTTVAMTHLVCSGVFDRLPNLKIITHHAGGMVPFYADRITGFYNKLEKTSAPDFLKRLTKAPIEYFKMFYADTALYGWTPGLMCAHAFFGADRMLFGT
ncbi:amidohydrolase family protein, partial [Chloroflexota bacterium]